MQLVEKFPGAKVARLERKLFYEEHGSRGKYVPTIFKGYVIYVDSNTSPPKQILSTLIHAGGGEVLPCSFFPKNMLNLELH
jgi:hypothetical protein